MVPIDIEQILRETGLSPRALAKIAGLSWGQFRKIRARGTMRRDDAKLLAENMKEHARSGRCNTALNLKRNGEVFTRPVYRVNLPGINRSASSEEIARLESLVT